MEKEYSILKAYYDKVLASSKGQEQFIHTEDVPTAPISMKDVIHQINNIGNNIDNKIEGLHEKSDTIIEQTQINEESMKSEEKMDKTFIMDDYVALKEDIREIKTSINWMKWVIPVLITISIFVFNNIVMSIKDSNSTQYQMLDKKLDSIKETSSLKIERDIAQEFLKQGKKLK